MSRPTIRVDGENIGLGDNIVVSYVHPTGPIVGLVGSVKRIRCYDEFTSDLIPCTIWIEDHRTGDLVEVRRESIRKIGQLDGPYMSQKEVNASVGAQRPLIASTFDLAVQLTGDLDELARDPAFAGASEIAAQAHDVAGALRATLDSLDD